MNPDVALALISRFRAAHVLVVGDVMLDRFIYGSAERLSPEAPIPILSVKRHLDMPGGAANVARNIVSLGGQCTLLSVVGEDSSADSLRRQLLEGQVKASLITDISRPTSLKTRYIAEGQQVLRADVESVAAINKPVSEELCRRFETLARDADIVVFSDYAKGVLSLEVVTQLIARTRSLGKPSVVDPKAKNLARYRGATLLTPNRTELHIATDAVCDTDLDVEIAAQSVIGAFVCESMVVTRGAAGMSVIGGGSEPVHLATQAREVFDVSGAGDTVVATLSLALAAAAPLRDAAALANLAAGVVVGKRGTAAVSQGELLSTFWPHGAHIEPSKLYSLDGVGPLVDEWRSRGLKVAFTNGCFDLLHPGHISLLEQARQSADRLVVGLNSDSSVRGLKGPARPAQGEIARAVVLAANKAVDAVVIFAEDTPLALIQRLRPDVLVKGADYRVDEVVGADDVRSWGGRVHLAHLSPGYSTTATLKRAVGG